MKQNFEKTRKYLLILFFIFLGVYFFVISDFFYIELRGYKLQLVYMYPIAIFTVLALIGSLIVLSFRLNLIKKYNIEGCDGVVLSIYKNGDNKIRAHINIKFSKWVKIRFGSCDAGLLLGRNSFNIINKLIEIFKSSSCLEMEVTSHLITEKIFDALKSNAKIQNVEIIASGLCHPSWVKRVVFCVAYGKKLNATNKITMNNMPKLYLA